MSRCGVSCRGGLHRSIVLVAKETHLDWLKGVLSVEGWWRGEGQCRKYFGTGPGYKCRDLSPDEGC